MELIYGDFERGRAFIQSIDPADLVGIFSHNDVDGFTSGLLMHYALGNCIKNIVFLSYSIDLVKNVIDIVKENHLTKVVFTDLNLAQNMDDLKKLSDIVPVLVIDHHQFPEDVNSNRLIFLRADSIHCAAQIVYELFREIPEYTSIKKYDWLTAIAIIADYTFEANSDFVKVIEEKYKINNIATSNSQAFSSGLGKMANTINNSTIYFYKDKNEFYHIFKELKSIEDIEKLARYSEPIEKEIQIKVKEFQEKHEKIKDVLFYKINFKYPITSALSSILASKYPESTIIVVVDTGEGIIKISSRCESGKYNLPDLLGLATDGLDEATSGGHLRAAGGSIRSEDYEKFKKQLFELIKNRVR
jgi:single-stranded DNA-specific DHH superfamily exonuclease